MAGRQANAPVAPSAWQKYGKKLVIVGIIIVLIIVLPNLAPLLESGADKAKQEILPPNESTGVNNTKVVVVVREIQVPGSINASENTRSYSDGQVFNMVKKLIINGCRISVKGSNLRTATPTEFQAFLKKLKESNSIATPLARGIVAESEAFYKGSQVCAGYFITKKDRTFLLVLVMMGNKPVLVKVDALADDPETQWSVWQAENDDTADSATGEAYIVVLTGG